MKKVAIHQPNFLPWIGYFHKVSLVDSFVFFDNVQFPRGKTFGNRVKIKTNNGEAWLTVPVLDKGDLPDFSDILINNTFPWQRKIMKTIELAYSKARYFKNYHEGFKTIFMEPYEKLSYLNIAMIRYLSEAIGLNTSFHLSSVLAPDPGMNAEERIMAILKQLGAITYVSGSGAGSRRYIDEEQFRKENINIEWQSFKCPVYSQLWGEFIPDLSIIDLVFNCGEESKDILSSVS